MRKRLEQVAAAALDDVLDDDALEQLRAAATDAARAALENEPPAVIYTNVRDFMTGYLMPMYRRSLSGSATTCAPNGGYTPKPTPASKPSGAPGNTAASTPSPASQSGSRDHLDHHMRILLDTEGPSKGPPR